MSLKGKPSTAHEYDKRDQCIYCGMYKNVVDQLAHVCTEQREIDADGIWLGRQMNADKAEVGVG